MDFGLKWDQTAGFQLTGTEDKDESNTSRNFAHFLPPPGKTPLFVGSPTKENYQSEKFINYALVEFKKFLNVILESMSKVMSSKWKSIFLFIWKSQIFLWKEFIKCYEFHRLSSWLSTSVDLHLPSSLELILENWKLAIYRRMKYLISNLV